MKLQRELWMARITFFSVSDFQQQYFDFGGLKLSSAAEPLFTSLNVSAPASFRLPSAHRRRVLLWLVMYHRPEQTPSILFPHELCWCFCNHWHVGNMANRGEGYSCDISTLWNLWRLFKDTVSANGLCALLQGLIVLKETYYVLLCFSFLSVFYIGSCAC